MNVVLVTLWVLAQTAMPFAHASFSGPASGEHKAKMVSKDATAVPDCLMHAAVEVEQKPGTDHHDAALDQCCSAACSVMGKFAAFEFHGKRVSQTFEQNPMQALTAVNLGLPTPPPNTTI